MNWLDILLLIILGAAAWKGFRRGFIIELASLVGVVLGIWAGIHLSERVIDSLELEVKSAAFAFLITFALVLALVVLIGHGLTKLIDLASLSIPNKIAGIAFGVLRSAFTLSIALNLLHGWTEGSMPPADVREASRLHAPVSAFAPLVVPALNDAKWMERLKEEVGVELRKD
ncbi:MAG: CvpA family protein [Flavobacteriales bacterium]|nr:CvpA family protein [Flavobacteriales bacterium]